MCELTNEEKMYLVDAHPLEFPVQSHIKRKIEVYIKPPDNGVNENTGFFLILHGAGGYAENPYFVKLREVWSNKYNVVTIGVNYLGTKYRKKDDMNLIWPENTVNKMKSLLQKTLPPSEWTQLFAQEGLTPEYLLLNYFSGQDIASEIQATNVSEVDKYSLSDYCDFGYIQTMDCLYALKFTIDLYQNNTPSLNQKRIYTFGSSLGGYLAQMCAKFAPNTFCLVADNSGFAHIPPEEIFPKEFNAYQRLVIDNNSYNITIGAFSESFYSNNSTDEFFFSGDMFRIRSLDDPEHIGTFKELTTTKIIMFHSQNDSLLNVSDKEHLHQSYINNGIDSQLFVFEKEDIDGKIIKSDRHAMDADLKRLFEKYCGHFVDENSAERIVKDSKNDFNDKSLLTYLGSKSTFVIDYKNGYPIISNHLLADRNLGVYALAAFPDEWNNQQLLKDSGLVPYMFHKVFGYDATLVGCKNGEYPYLDSYLTGLRMDFLPPCKDVSQLVKHSIEYISYHYTSMDIIILYGPYIPYTYMITHYRKLRPDGKVYLALDANSHWMDRMPWDSPEYMTLFESCDVMATSCRKMQTFLNSKWPNFKIAHITNGFFNVTGEPLHIEASEKENIILTVARIGTFQKANHIMLEAFANVHDYLPDWKMHLVGSIDENFSNYVETYFNKYPQLKDKVIFKGLVEDKYKLLAE